MPRNAHDNRESTNWTLQRNRFGLVQVAALVPLLLILGYAVAGQVGLMTAATCGTALLFLMAPRRAEAAGRDAGQSHSRSALLLDRTALAARADQYLARSVFSIGLMTLEIDQFKSLSERFDHAQLDRLLLQCADRIFDLLGENDYAARLDRPSFLILLGPNEELELETALQAAARIQSVLSEPFTIDGSTVQITASIGFSLSNRMPTPTASTMMQASLAAMIEAQRSGPAGVRSFSDAMRKRIDARKILADDVHSAFANEQISAYFQPQVSTHTGEISGFETLARWHHPTRGPVPPSEFLPAFQDAGAMDRLGQFMLEQALIALRYWQDNDIEIPRVGVNLSSVELSDPDLVKRIQSTLQCFDIGAERLCIEVLETVVAHQVSGTVIENLAALSKMGCGIDLDDFGTGHASITSIRRFSIERIKIDRSFVTNIDEDPEQQNMLQAILTMAERLGLDALAEGVETQSEEAMLSRLGCAHVQGFGVAYPMPLAETLDWIKAHRARSAGPVRMTGTHR